MLSYDHLGGVLVKENKKHTVHFKNINSASLALSVALFFKQHKKQTLIIAENSHQAQDIYDNLKFFYPDLPLCQFSDWKVLPYDIFSPDDFVTSQRIKSLYELIYEPDKIYISSIPALVQKITPKSYIVENVFDLNIDQNINQQSFIDNLIESGFVRVDKVESMGEIAVRGSVVDFYTYIYSYPIRVEFFDNSIESIRIFDAETNDIIEKKQSLKIFPSKEFPANIENLALLKQKLIASFGDLVKSSLVFEDLENQLIFKGIENYLPLFFDKLNTLFDYLSDEANIFYSSNSESLLDNLWEGIEHRYDLQIQQKFRPALKPKELFVSKSIFFERLNHFETFQYHPLNSRSSSSRPIKQIDFLHKPQNIQSHNIQGLLDSFNKNKNAYFILCLPTQGRINYYQEILAQNNIKTLVLKNWQDVFAHKPTLMDKDQPIFLCLSGLSEPIQYYINQWNYHFYNEMSLFTYEISPKKLNTKNPLFNRAEKIISLDEIKIGSPVVHINHGVGVYKGIELMDVDDEANEMLCIEYRNNDKLYVPITDINLIAKYEVPDHMKDQVRIDTLGGKSWQTKKNNTIKKIIDVSAQLIEIYASRKSAQGFSFEFDEEIYQKFSDKFYYELTSDQHTTITQIIEDMQAQNPMDRLVCGDVGFGKTEVAIRAAYIAACNAKQTAILVPTTLLAEQHFENFYERFSDFNIKVGVLSRLKSTKERAKVLEDLKSGKLDIIIATHALLGKKIEFNNLGLLVIDEEHKFGVMHKEKIKLLKPNVDIITMSATPIPRTLNMAFSNLKDISIIATAPSRRLETKTHIHQFDLEFIKEGILREIHRGGQVFFVHNDLATIDELASEIRSLLSEARVAVAHGKMQSTYLENIMHDFYQQKYNVLICSTIIENGIDIPNANTIIINKAHHFGLPQLHQLRGRVGRSHYQSYCYLMIDRNITKEGLAKINIIKENSKIGSGFQIANLDLELRGSGELLGKEQSGFFSSIGVSLYLQLLDKVVKMMSKNATIDKEKLLKSLSIGNQIEVELHISAYIPENYMSKVENRVYFYRQIANADSITNVIEIKSRLIDLFSFPPKPLDQLLELQKIKILALSLGVKKIASHYKAISLYFDEDNNSVPIDKIINFVTLYAKIAKIQGSKLQIFGDFYDEDKVLTRLADVIKILKA